MDATHVIDVEEIKDSDKRSVPVVDLEENQKDEEIILVGEKRKNSDRQNRPNKRRKIELADDSSVDPLHLFEQKEKEFQRIRRSFPTTNPLQFLPFEIIEQICHSLSLPDYLHLLWTNKSWSACRDMFPWKYLCSQMFDIALMMKLKGTWYERLKFKMALEKNWRDDIKLSAKFTAKYGYRVIHTPSYTIIQTKDFAPKPNTKTEFKLVDGTKLEKLLEVPLIVSAGYHGTPHAYVPPIHVFQTEENKILGTYYSDCEWSRTSSRKVSRWFLESSEQLPNEISLEDIFNKKVKALKYQDEDIFGIALDLDADCATAFLSETSSFVVDKITSSEKLLQTEPVLADGQFYHINGDFILYSTPSQQLMILNWKTNEVTSLEFMKSGIPVALALPKGFFKNNCEYSIYADSQRVALISLNDATIERIYESPPKFKPQFLQLWPGDKSKFFSVGSNIHIWSVERSGIIDTIFVHPVHPLSNNEAYPFKIIFRDNKIFLQYSTVSHVLSKTSDGSYELMNSFKDRSCDFDECHLFINEYTEDFSIKDFTPKPTPNTSNSNNNQSNVICILE